MVENIFLVTLVGGAMLTIYDELYFWEEHNLINYILTSHEQGVIHLPAAYVPTIGGQIFVLLIRD